MQINLLFKGNGFTWRKPSLQTRINLQGGGAQEYISLSLPEAAGFECVFFPAKIDDQANMRLHIQRARHTLNYDVTVRDATG